MNTWSSLVSLEAAGAVGIVRLNNPPVNALSHAVRTGLVAAVHQAAKLPDIKVLLIVAAGDLFCAGVDISEFDRPLEEPSLHAVEAAIETFHLPVVAAIHGMALGGGLELAMACHYRLVHKNARLGMPEINLGLIPWSGRNWRLQTRISNNGTSNIPDASPEPRTTLGLSSQQ